MLEMDERWPNEKMAKENKVKQMTRLHECDLFLYLEAISQAFPLMCDNSREVI